MAGRWRRDRGGDEARAAVAGIDVSLLSERVYRALRDAIFRQTLHPATRLDVRELAATYGTSVAPVRHALARLHDEGMVEIVPRRGTFVSRVRPRDVREVFQVRRIVEAGAVELLGARLPDGAGASLLRVVERTESLGAGDHFRDYPTYIQLDAEFHRIPVRALDNPRLLRLFDGLHSHIQIARGLYPASDQRARSTLAEHRRILEAYLGHDVDAAKEAILVHLANGEADLLRRLGDGTGGSPDGANGRRAGATYEGAASNSGSREDEPGPGARRAHRRMTGSRDREQAGGDVRAM